MDQPIDERPTIVDVEREGLPRQGRYACRKAYERRLIEMGDHVRLRRRLNVGKNDPNLVPLE